MLRAFKATHRDPIFDLLVNGLLLIVLLATLAPLVYVLLVSFTPLPVRTLAGVHPLLTPSNWSFESYRQLLGQDSFLRATLNSMMVTLGGVTINMFLTVLTAYALSWKTLPGRNTFTFLILFTFLFNPGLVPTYLLVRDLGLIDTFAAIVLPGAISVYNLLVMRSFFQNLPDGLREAALIDGANELQVLWHVVLPLSRPILLTIGLFYMVNHWNEFFLPILYINDNDMLLLPVLLRNILLAANMNEYVESNVVSAASPESIKMAAVLLAMLPMLLVYPWIQRHFTKGVLVGGIKE
jgi:putative aldouronate transport system permease protein